MHDVSRRCFIFTGLSALVAGCAEATRLQGSRTEAHGVGRIASSRVSGPYATPRTSSENLLRSQSESAAIMAVPRSRWAEAQPVQSRLAAMGPVQRITIHHEGWTPVWFEDTRATARRLESIRLAHLQRMKAGDIGYHMVIDRAGRVWQGRELCYQGAHVRDHNVGNIGVMVLGNFDLQRPTDRQIASLSAMLTKLMRRYHIRESGVHTHQELNITACPGRALQAGVSSLRRGGLV